MAAGYRRYLAFTPTRRQLAAGPLGRGSSRPRGLTAILLWIAAAVLLFEEWFWARSTHAIARFAVITHLTAVGDWIRRRPPIQALALFIVPVLAIYPFKVLALMALARGDVALGSAAFVGAKLVATAVFARLYELTEPAIIRFKWIRIGRDAFLRARAFIHAWLEAQAPYRHARAMIRRQAAHFAYRYRVARRLQGRRRQLQRTEAWSYRRDIEQSSPMPSFRARWPAARRNQPRSFYVRPQRRR